MKRQVDDLQVIIILTRLVFLPVCTFRQERVIFFSVISDIFADYGFVMVPIVMAARIIENLKILVLLKNISERLFKNIEYFFKI